jgi:hypothetical protein
MTRAVLGPTPGISSRRSVSVIGIRVPCPGPSSSWVVDSSARRMVMRAVSLSICTVR